MLDTDPFRRHAAFTLWRLARHPVDAAKKPIKIPVHYDGHTRHSLGRPARGSLPAVAPNPAPPLTAEQAQQWLAYCRQTGVGHDRPGEPGYLGIGFRPAGTGLACLDIDNCLAGGQWSSTALEMMARFPGALLELSTSGTGLHIWFTYAGESPGRNGRDASGELELYAEGQFIAAGTVLQGDASLDCTAAMRALVAERWPGRPAGGGAFAANDWLEKTDEQRQATRAQILDACRHIAGDNSYDYHRWVDVGMRLASLGDDGHDLWHEFSSWHPQYDYDTCEAKWEQLAPDRTDYRALFADAQRTGWVNPESREARLETVRAGVAEAFGALETLAGGSAQAGPGGFGLVAAPRPVERPNTAGTRMQAADDAIDVVARPVAAESQPNTAVDGAVSAPAAISSGAPFACGAVDGWQPPPGTPPPPSSGAYEGPPPKPAVDVLDSMGESLGIAEAAAGGMPATLSNVLDVLTGQSLRTRLGWDDFYGSQMIAPDGQVWRPVDNEDPALLRIVLERGGFKPVPPEIMKSAMAVACRQNRFDSARQWADGLVWDGVPRVETALSRYFGCADTPYSRAVAMYLFSAFAGRAMDPGCQADMVPVFVGRQGARKTSAVRALAPIPQSFVALDLSKRDDDLSRRLRGKLVAEWAELRGLTGRDVTAVRAWITTRSESWIEKYETKERTFGRRFIVIGTANEDELLDDAEGERRWLPIRVEPEGVIDVEGLARDCQQLWAEGVAVWRRDGVQWREAEALARGEHWKYKVQDDLAAKIMAWLDATAEAVGQPLVGGEQITGLPRGQTPFTIYDVATRCLQFRDDRIDHKLRLRIGKILRRLGYDKTWVWENSHSVGKWAPVGHREA